MSPSQTLPTLSPASGLGPLDASLQAGASLRSLPSKVLARHSDGEGEAWQDCDGRRTMNSDITARVPMCGELHTSFLGLLCRF
jgi:hypothetical protein